MTDMYIIIDYVAPRSHQGQPSSFPTNAHPDRHIAK